MDGIYRIGKLLMKAIGCSGDVNQLVVWCRVSELDSLNLNVRKLSSRSVLHLERSPCEHASVLNNFHAIFCWIIVTFPFPSHCVLLITIILWTKLVHPQKTIVARCMQIFFSGFLCQSAFSRSNSPRIVEFRWALTTLENAESIYSRPLILMSPLLPFHPLDLQRSDQRWKFSSCMTFRELLQAMLRSYVIGLPSKLQDLIFDILVLVKTSSYFRKSRKMYGGENIAGK